jgi:hypothetical protein
MSPCLDGYFDGRVRAYALDRPSSYALGPFGFDDSFIADGAGATTSTRWPGPSTSSN